MKTFFVCNQRQHCDDDDNDVVLALWLVDYLSQILAAPRKIQNEAATWEIFGNFEIEDNTSIQRHSSPIYICEEKEKECQLCHIHTQIGVIIYFCVGEESFRKKKRGK